MADEPIQNGEHTPNGDGGNKKIEFSPEQQAKVQELIDSAVGRVAARIRSESETKLTALQNELNEAKEAAKNARTAGARSEATDDVARLQAQIDEMKTASKSIKDEVTRWQSEAQKKAQEADAARAETLRTRKEVAITNAASKVNFVNTEVVAKLTQDQVQWDADKGRFVVINEAGQERLNAAMEPMSLDEFYNDFAAKNKYLVRGDVHSGTGSSESMRSSLTSNGKYEVAQIFGPKSDSRLANDLAKKDPAEYKRLKVIARQAGLVV